MDGGAWWAAVHGVAKSQTWPSNLAFTFHFHAREKEMATHASILAWRIPGTPEPGGLPSVGSHRVGHDWSDLAAAANIEVSRKESESRSVMSDYLQPHGLYSPWNSPGQNTGVGSLSLLQGIFLIQGSNPGLPYCRWILYQLSHKGSPRILEWVAYPFSSRSFQPRNRTRVSCIAAGFFTNWAMREAQNISKCNLRWCPSDDGWDVSFENTLLCLAYVPA